MALDKGTSRLSIILGVLFAGAIFAAMLNSPDIEATSTKTLKGIMYKTPSGDIVEVVEVPNFGKCFITAVMMYCK